MSLSEPFSLHDYFYPETNYLICRRMNKCDNEWVLRTIHYRKLTVFNNMAIFNSYLLLSKHQLKINLRQIQADLFNNFLLRAIDELNFMKLFEECNLYKNNFYWSKIKSLLKASYFFSLWSYLYRVFSIKYKLENMRFITFIF